MTQFWVSIAHLFTLVLLNLHTHTPCTLTIIKKYTPTHTQIAGLACFLSCTPLECPDYQNAWEEKPQGACEKYTNVTTRREKNLGTEVTEHSLLLGPWKKWFLEKALEGREVFWLSFYFRKLIKKSKYWQDSKASESRLREWNGQESSHVSHPKKWNSIVLAILRQCLSRMGHDSHHSLQTTITHPQSLPREGSHGTAVIWRSGDSVLYPNSIFWILFHRILEQSYKAINLLTAPWALAQLCRTPSCPSRREHRNSVGS